ncbi:cytochrome b [Litorimonas sp. WD9-15]|uniref:cytochrome b n=1 Tax=Litorimonas sp. WD9-15 TaxID=3418716 RepID=UPI003D01F8EE
MATKSESYSRVAIAFHWAIALLIIGLVLFGWLMTHEWMPNRFAIYQWHKSFGILVLVLSLGRLIWRFMNPPPALPDGMKGWETVAAKITHIGFYVLMIGMPLLGWAMISASRLPIENELFYLIPLPDLPGISASDAVEARFKLLHEIGAKLIIVLFVLHVGGALKHHFISKDNVLARMIPALRRP